jgi:hypothetical protein
MSIQKIKPKKNRKIKFEKGIKRIYFPLMESNPYRAFEIVKAMDLPKYRIMGFEVLCYTGKNGFNTYPTVYIEK